MIFTATEEQLKSIAANAYNASSPMGMGFMHATPEDRKPENFTLGAGSGLSMDDVHGRMVKFYAAPCVGGFRVTDAAARGDYQSWVGRYPTYSALVTSVPGVEIVEESSP